MGVDENIGQWSIAKFLDDVIKPGLSQSGSSTMAIEICNHLEEALRDINDDCVHCAVGLLCSLHPNTATIVNILTFPSRVSSFY